MSDQEVQAFTADEFMEKLTSITTDAASKSDEKYQRMLMFAKNDMMGIIIRLMDSLHKETDLATEDVMEACFHVIISTIKILVPLSAQGNHNIVPEIFDNLAEVLPVEMRQAGKSYKELAERRNRGSVN